MIKMVKLNEKRINVRTSKKVIENIKELRKKFPQDYKSTSAVIRAGIIVLYRWKTKEGENNGYSNKTTAKSII